MFVAPSILSCNFNNLLDDVKSISEAKYLHIDVMDGHFVPNISFGPCVFKNLRDYCNQIFDCHLMIEEPLKYIKDYANSHADIITFHYEAKSNILDTINEIRKYNCKVGLSIKPNTKVEEINKYLPLVDLVLVMSVEPGFGGQKFMPIALDKIKYLYDYRKNNNLNYLIEVDGGINYETSKYCLDAGCDIAVAGSFIFNNTNRNEIIKNIEVMKSEK